MAARKFGGRGRKYTAPELRKLARRSFSDLTPNQQGALRSWRGVRAAKTREAAIARRPAQAGWERRSKKALVRAIVELPPGPGRTAAHRALWDRLADSRGRVDRAHWADTMVDLYGDYGDLDYEDADDLIDRYH